MYTPLITLAYLLLPGVGRKTIQSLIRSNSSPQTPAEILSHLVAAKKSSLKKIPTASEVTTAFDLAKRHLDRLARMGGGVITPGMKEFPHRLECIPDAPVILFYCGTPAALSRSCAVAVIGTREPSDFGRACARRFGHRFAGLGASVVSGLARGCDAEAHQGCLDGKGVTIAVLAHGLDTVYPKDHKGLSERIVETGGCLVSEYPLGAKPQKSHFVERDRLQSGLADAVVVVETGSTGGTLHTVGAARSQGRPVAVLKHPDHLARHPKAEGNSNLLAEGSMALRDGADLAKLIDSLAHRYDDKASAHFGDSVLPNASEPHHLSPDPSSGPLDREQSHEPVQGDLF